MTSFTEKVTIFRGTQGKIMAYLLWKIKDIHTYKRITGFSALIHRISEFSRTKKSPTIIRMKLNDAETSSNPVSTSFLLQRTRTDSN